MKDTFILLEASTLIGGEEPATNQNTLTVVVINTKSAITNFPRMNEKVSDRSQPRKVFDLSLSETADARSLDRPLGGDFIIVIGYDPSFCSRLNEPVLNYK